MKDYSLIIFDMDGTLADRDTGELLEGVGEYFSSLADKPPKFALATNQGGVGLRYWMETGDWGKDIEKLPTITDVNKHISKVVSSINFGPNTPIMRFEIYKCFAYITKKGVLAPVPNGASLNPDWNPNCRKPNPGMLMRAMLDANVQPQETLMVGDRPEDEEAAKRAGCDFMWAWEFFGRDEPDEA